ncbi:DUF6928 family protein [Amycolatopsis lurida]
MGAVTAMLVYSEDDAKVVLPGHPVPDREATRAMARRLQPHGVLEEIGDGNLLENVNPPDGRMYVGCFPGLTVICAPEAAVDQPSQLPPNLLEPAGNATVYLHAMHSAVDWFAYAMWERGTLVRSLSLAPEYGILEETGDALMFEKPYWSGDRAPMRPCPFPFHPLDLGEEALRAMFGITYEGKPFDGDPDLREITLLGFRYDDSPGIQETVGSSGLETS